MANPRGRPPKKSPTFNRPVRDFEPPALEVKEPLPNFELLGEAEKHELRQKALVKVEAREKDRAMEAYLAKEIERIEREIHPEAYEEDKEITIDLALYADRIVINGRHYMHGRTYTVKKSLYDCLQDITFKTHKHYADTHRDPMRAFYESQRATISKDGPSYATLNAQSGQVAKF